MRRLLPLIAALTVLSGCATATVSPAPTTTSAAPVARARVVPAVATRAPTLATTGTNWPKITGSLITYGQWLLANPNPALADNITVPGCAANTQIKSTLQTYVDQNAYVQPAAPTLPSLIAPTGTIGAQVSLDLQAVRGIEPIHQRTAAGSTTHVLAERPVLSPTSLNVVLIRGADAHWRICTATDPQNPDTDALTTLL